MDSSSQSQADRPTTFHQERQTTKDAYIASNDPSLVSLHFVAGVYKSEGSYWTKEMDAATVALMIQHSSILGIYRQAQRQQEPTKDSTQALYQRLEQIGMARFITDHVTHAYLTDVYITPSYRGHGLGAWLVECCGQYMEQLPFLRKAMLCTSDPLKNAGFYQEKLGMHVPVQDPEKHLILLRKGGGQVRSVPMSGEALNEGNSKE